MNADQVEKFFNPSQEYITRNGLISMIRGISRAIKEFQDQGQTPQKSLTLLAKAEDSYKAKYGEYPKI